MRLMKWKYIYGIASFDGRQIVVVVVVAAVIYFTEIVGGNGDSSNAMG